MGMFNIGDNKIFRDILGGYPDDKDFVQAPVTDAQTQAATEKLKVLRTYVDGSAAMTQRAAPDLLAGLGAAAFQLSSKVRTPDGSPFQMDVNLMPSLQSSAAIPQGTLEDTLLAKVKALDDTIHHDTSSMAEANSVTNFRQALMLTQDLTSSKLEADPKRNVALALKPVLESFKTAYTNDLRALAAEIPAAKIENLEKVKLGEYKGLTDQEIQYVEKYQRLQTTEIQLESVRALI